MDSRDYFIYATQFLLKRGGHTQVFLAKHMRIDPPQLSQFLNKTRNFSEQKREQIASFFGRTYLRMLNYGELLAGAKIFFPIGIREFNTYQNMRLVYGSGLGLDFSEEQIKTFFSGDRYLELEFQPRFVKPLGMSHETLLEYGRLLFVTQNDNNESFLSLNNKSRVTKEHSLKDSSEDLIVLKHQQIVPGFKDKTTGLSVNQNMIKIEAKDPAKYYKLVGRIETIAEEVDEKIDIPTTNPNDKDTRGNKVG